MLPLRWSEQALEHMGGIAEYLSLSSPLYAESAIQRIEARVQQLQLHPELGKPARESSDPSVRELVDAPYRVFYRARADCIEVIAVVHGRNQVPTSL
ncbi:MAG: type II toxin-antitoxin system RelE/ParE family toxin [Candidatus Omnitrophota bacterium]|jgi:plasmid stabilization system protein ParE